MQFKYYCYRHIRLDKNEVFYIGVGKSRNYERAKVTKGRNPHWRNIVKLSKYEIEIIFESNNREEILQKEIEFITLYGRNDLNKGTLVNMTDGGDGLFGFCPSRLIKTVYCYSLDGEFVKEFAHARIASEFYNISCSDIVSCCKGRRRTKNNLQWRYFKAEKILAIKSRYESAADKLSRPIIQVDNTGKEILRFNTARLAAKYFQMSTTTVNKYCKNKIQKKIGPNKDLQLQFL